MTTSGALRCSTATADRQTSPRRRPAETTEAEKITPRPSSVFAQSEGLLWDGLARTGLAPSARKQVGVRHAACFDCSLGNDTPGGGSRGPLTHLTAHPQ